MKGIVKVVVLLSLLAASSAGHAMSEWERAYYRGLCSKGNYFACWKL